MVNIDLFTFCVLYYLFFVCTVVFNRPEEILFDDKEI